MKKTLLSITLFFASIFSIDAQTLYGLTLNGGNEGQGVINKLIPATNNFTIARSFENIAYDPGSKFIQATDGKFYATTSEGGANGYGVIFSYDPNTSIYTKLYDFDNTNGYFSFHSGSLVQASNGKLYGAAGRGGNNNDGVIFSFDPSSSIYTKLMDFDSTNGASPGDLMQASDGKLYGVTIAGGRKDSGVIYSFDPLSATYTKLYSFDKTSGGYPVATSLIQANDGKLYGTATYGGSNGSGVIFSFDRATSTYTKLYDFNSDGFNPFGSLVQASNGKLYGVTKLLLAELNMGTGTIFSFDPSTSTYTKLWDFGDENGSGDSNGDVPSGSLIQAGNGKIYGMTAAGGSFNSGVIFSFDPSAPVYTKVKDFDGINGSTPQGSLIPASDGKLYGMTSLGGNSRIGVIFSFDPIASAYTKLKNFENINGQNPSGSLVLASDGKLYGMGAGGGYNNGVIFSFEPSSSIYSKLKDFDDSSGQYPLGSLIQATDGKLYGMTSSGGSNGSGVVFSLDPSSAAYTKLKDFDPTNGFSGVNINGAKPYGSLMQAADGKLYGMTQVGGSSGSGVIFSYVVSSSTYTVVHNFYAPEGAGPLGSLIQATDGKLYGVTSSGGSDAIGNILTNGLIFSFDPASSTYTILKQFGGTNGFHPYGSLVKADDGRLYGMTLDGGTKGFGVIFSYDPISAIYRKLKDFDSTSGGNPFGNLLQAGNGKLYGMTRALGANGLGTVFSFDPSSSVFTKLQDFDNANGANPYFGSAFIEVPEAGPLPVTVLNFAGKNNGNNNQLSWKVENEQNLNYYELQRSIDGQNFKEITQIKAAGNNSYTYYDNIAAASSVYYYRLKSVDKDGKSKYSMVIKIRTNVNRLAVANPNPFKNKLVINIESLIQNKATFIITDISGRQLYRKNKLLSTGSNVVEINEAGKLSKGTYLLTIIESQQTQSIKIVKGN